MDTATALMALLLSTGGAAVSAEPPSAAPAAVVPPTADAEPARRPRSMEDYAMPGQLEAGGLFELSNVVDDPETDGDDKLVTSVVRVAPVVGYFATKHLEFLGELDLRTVTERDEEFSAHSVRTDVSVGVGAGYFIRIGNLHVGPRALVRIHMATVVVSGAEPTGQDLQGPGAHVGLQAKVPVGGGGVVAIGVGVDRDRLRSSLSGFGDLDDDTGTQTTVGTQLGFLLYF